MGKDYNMSSGYLANIIHRDHKTLDETSFMHGKTVNIEVLYRYRGNPEELSDEEFINGAFNRPVEDFINGELNNSVVVSGDDVYLKEIQKLNTIQLPHLFKVLILEDSSLSGISDHMIKTYSREINLISNGKISLVDVIIEEPNHVLASKTDSV